MHGECHFNSRASATRQRKNPHPATSMAVLRAPHQATASASLAKFRNRSKPCCQPVKAMLKNWSTGQSHVAFRLQNVFTATADNWRLPGLNSLPRAECKPGLHASQTVANRQERTDNRQPIGFLSLMQPHIQVTGHMQVNSSASSLSESSSSAETLAEQMLERILWEMLMMGIPVSFHLHEHAQHHVC